MSNEGIVTRIQPSQPWPDPPEEKTSRDIEVSRVARKPLSIDPPSIWRFLPGVVLLIYIAWYFLAN